MRRILTSALTVLVAAAVPAAANAQLPQIPQLPASSSSNFQDEINHRIDDARAQVEDITSKAFPQKAPKQKAPTPAKKTEPRNSGGVDCANCVAITYDDGPGAETNRLPDKLKAKNAHASFMVIAPSAEQHPELLKRMKAEGHTIGNHTVDHPVLPRLSQDGINRQLDGTNAAIRNTTGQNPRWMRPPYGEYDARVTAASQSRGMAVALWDVDTLDWKHRNATKTCAVAVQQSRPGSVVLMHDIHGPTVDAVPCIIDGLRAKGLRPVSLDQMITSPQAGRVYSHRR